MRGSGGGRRVPDEAAPVPADEGGGEEVARF
uniref:Uncharacterized protein n=1 Tax=Arundo donax TaxID=35708 RepID=A0A0A8ZD74_ARUDO